MAIKTILTCLSSAESARDGVAAAVLLAVQHGAFLIGLSTPQQLTANPSVAVYVPATVGAEFLRPDEKLTKELEGQFHEATRSENLASEHRIAKLPMPIPDQKAWVMHRRTDGLSTTGVLKREAQERDADLILTGAIGYSRFFDFVIGAVTFELMRTSEVQVLFSQ